MLGRPSASGSRWPQQRRAASPGARAPPGVSERVRRGVLVLLGERPRLGDLPDEWERPLPLDDLEEREDDRERDPWFLPRPLEPFLPHDGGRSRPRDGVRPLDCEGVRERVRERARERARERGGGQMAKNGGREGARERGSVHGSVGA